MEKLFIDNHPETGLPVYRSFPGKFTTDEEDQEVITVIYDEWQETPNGTEILKVRKKYHVKGDKYTGWVTFKPNIELTEETALTLRQLFRTAINQTLQSLPIGFPDGGVI
jgi:hypothetical protein